MQQPLSIDDDSGAGLISNSAAATSHTRADDWYVCCWIDLSNNGPNGPFGHWLASGSGTPSLLEGWWAPVAQHYKREWGPRAQDTRFAAATVAHTPNPSRRRGCAEVTGCPHPRRHRTSPSSPASLHRAVLVVDGSPEPRYELHTVQPTRSTTSRSGDSINGIRARLGSRSCLGK
jgi:hypothetical protein